MGTVRCAVIFVYRIKIYKLKKLKKEILSRMFLCKIQGNIFFLEIFVDRIFRILSAHPGVEVTLANKEKKKYGIKLGKCVTVQEVECIYN